MLHGLTVGHRPKGKGAGFTLAELLIVIAIIGVLIAILLPALSAARRAAAATKCLSSLRDLGLAFQQYAQDNKRAFPVTDWAPPATWVTDQVERRPWQYFLFKYVHRGRDITPATKDTILSQVKTNSVFWGCPNFNEDNWSNAAPDAAFAAYTIPSRYNTGYGMSRYGLAPYYTAAPPPTSDSTWGGSAGANGTGFGKFSPVIQGTFAVVREAGSVNGSFLKMEQWSRRGASKGLLADANFFEIIGSATWGKSAAFGTVRKTDPFLQSGALTGSYLTVDSMRHITPGSPAQKQASSKGINILYADGHAGSVTPDEAWIAIRGGGYDLRGP
jgi:prepilin-type N-terminal cleavage/methylation domain-containing protein/prepilin-type processing-associated H-X9-DG protein